MDIYTILTVKWCKDACATILCGWYHFLQNTLLALLHPNRCAVEFVTQPHSSFMVACYVCAVCIVELSRSHSVPIVHSVSPDVSYKNTSVYYNSIIHFLFLQQRQSPVTPSMTGDCYCSHLTVYPATFYKIQI